MENGFKFSSSKTLGMHFCNKRGLHPDPELKLYNSPIKIVSETKYLGFLFDNTLTLQRGCFPGELPSLVPECQNRLN
jgi:hypothetical protein